MDSESVSRWVSLSFVGIITPHWATRSSPTRTPKAGAGGGTALEWSRSNIGGQHFSDELLIRSRHSIP